MTRTIYFLYDSDAYELEVDTHNHTHTAIWRYSANRPARPTAICYADCSEELRNIIDNKIMRNLNHDDLD